MPDDHEIPVERMPRPELARPVRYTLPDLTHESGIPGRTIRYYISLGLLQPAYGRGKMATYDSDHLLRLNLIQRLKDERLPLNDIREQLSHLTSEDVERVLHVQLRPTVDSWKRFSLHSDLEIVVRERSLLERSSAEEQAFDDIVEYARSVLQNLERNSG
ncbi:MAG: MerR family transcriptional regulator [Thermomicrobiales bacterium]